MKKTCLILLIFSQFAILKGQPYYSFPDSNTIWHHLFSIAFSSRSDTSYYYSYGLMGDTIINTRLYSKVYKLNDTVLNSNATYHGCLREDSSKKVFYIGWDFVKFQYFSEEIQLYDFSKGIGDSVVYGFWGKYPITFVDSIMIDQHYRKRFGVLWDTIIEGIGSVNDLLSPINSIPTKVFTNWDLVCFKQNEEVLFLNENYSSCFSPITNIRLSSKNSNANIKIYPQPLTNTSIIDLSETKIQFKDLMIYDLRGERILYYETSNKKTIPLSRNDFSSGLFFYKLESLDGQIITGKFIVE